MIESDQRQSRIKRSRLIMLLIVDLRPKVVFTCKFRRQLIHDEEWSHVPLTHT